MLRILTIAVVLFITVRGVRTEVVCCPGLDCYSDAAPWNGFDLPQCPEKMGIDMKVYTRQNPTDGQPITRDSTPSVFDGNRTTMFIVHGWKGDGNLPWMHEMKNAVLEKADFNVIIVGWKEGANHFWYRHAASNTRTVGGEIALISNKTINASGSSRARQYCVGFSLGAHVCGHAGKQGQFGRITGLDPAGPEFQNRDVSSGLNPSCADFVDVVHTDGNVLGTMKRLGHVDFYPNGGKVQPGCLSSYVGVNIFTDWIEKLVGCDHFRAYEYFIESIRNNCFLSRHTCINERLLPASCTASNNTVQCKGFKSIDYSSKGIFYLTTNSKSPYCKG